MKSYPLLKITFSILLVIVFATTTPVALIAQQNSAPKEAAKTEAAKTKSSTPPQDEEATSGVDWNGPWVKLERAYPNLRFDRPVFLTNAGDGSGRMFVLNNRV